MERLSVEKCSSGGIMSEHDSWELPFYSPSSIEEEKFPLLYELVEHNWEDMKEIETKDRVWSETSQAENSGPQRTQPRHEGIKRRKQNKANLPSDSTGSFHTVSISETNDLHRFSYARSNVTNEAIYSDTSITSAPAVCMTSRIQVSQVDEILETVGQPPIFNSSAGKSEEELREQRKQHLKALKSLTPEQRTLRRILRNRKSAANARKRHIERLQQLERENEELKCKIGQLEEKLREYEKRG
ncbi:hypothetical protein Gasu2_30610 [Galdieria sulphuraria]|uniref:BZIP domain-containing protein n=1 Tax=Galdieria sulphuraria TaxID=130081 RepID=M2WQI7_GALSU|nr:uncharacterized protein Gasu_62950 [Galdieria sulphuraria]EME26050.1 hypothetical protein Gasu_62950 [Galdieria sulphuraria]GJD08774.1 hypothetical protein Gasu2_30610 [Galdieria sulphuraria]|eukprot:XP_005702570.1 hypothetical protein Gasu_62950 [Galdieria sulphuraria]